MNSHLMNNFCFFNPVRVYFGRVQIEQITMEIPASRWVMIVYGGGSVKANGILNRVRNTLKNVTVFEFGGIEANPHYETLCRAIEVVKMKTLITSGCRRPLLSMVRNIVPLPRLNPRPVFCVTGRKSLADYNLGAEVSPSVITKEQEHGNIALSERRNITPEDVTGILPL